MLEQAARLDNLPPIQIINSFCEANGLTPREKEIVVCFLQGLVTNDDIGKTLKLSPFTVSNHVKSILQKTSTSSKAEILSFFIRHMSTEQRDWQIFVKRPRVLIVDDEPDICQILKSDLESRGFNVFIETDSDKVPDLVRNLNFDVIVSDIMMPTLSGIDLLKIIQESGRELPMIIFMTGFSTYDESELLSLGAAGFIQKPIDFKELHFLILENYIEDPQTLSRFRRVKTHLALENFGKEYCIKNIGFGGIFVQVPPLDLPKDSRLEDGALIDLAFQVDEDSPLINCTVKVEWIRRKSQQHLYSGFGARFVKISDHDHFLIRKFIRAKRVLALFP